MRIKRYRARDAREAYRAIKADMGEDALILEVGRAREGGLGGLFRPHLVEVLAACEDRPAVAEPRGLAGAGEPLLALESDLAQLRQQVADLSGRLTPGVALPGRLRRVVERLASLGIDPPQAHRLLAGVQHTLSPRALQSEQSVWLALQRQAAELVQTRPPLGERPRTSRVVFLIGPTGVGKTTTIAKLAANLTLAHGRRVGLITVDTYRVGAVAQLQSFADILGLPLHVAYDAQELAEHVARHADKEYVLVDTPGRSQHNREHLEELRLFLSAVPRREVLLSLALTTALPEALEIVRRFQVVPIDGLVVTKLDEVRMRGCLLTLAERAALPVAYLTTGQQVPQDIECATPSGIAAWALRREEADQAC